MLDYCYGVIYIFFKMRGCQVRLVDDQKICFFSIPV